MKARFDDRIARAQELSKTHPAASELLNFYGQLALFQRPIYDELQSSGQADMHALLTHFPALLKLVRRSGPAPLADFGSEHLSSPDSQWELLLSCWEDPAGESRAATGAACSEAGRFFARVVLQPFAECLASRGKIDL